jgi:O-antigen/teichoic acid export membrane protein
MATSIELEQYVSEQRAVPSLRSNIRWTLAGNVLYAACQWGMLSVIAKLGTSAAVGQFALGLAICAPVYMFTNFQLRAVQATDSRNEFQFSDYFTLRLLATGVGWVSVLGIVLALQYDPITTQVIVLISSAKAIECLSDVIAGLLQKEERLDRVAVSLLIRGSSSLIAFALIFLYSESLVAAVIGMLLAWCSVLVLYDLRWASTYAGNWRRFISFNRTVQRRLLVLSLPLGIVMTLLSLNVNAPRYFLQHFLGSSILGIFASLAYAVVAVGLIVNAVGQSASTRLSQMFADRRTGEFWRLTLKLCLLGVAIIFTGVPLAIVIGRPVLTLLYRREYAEHIGVLALMVASAGVSAVASFLGYGVTAARQFRQQVPVVFASTVFTVVMAFFLVPRFGLAGAAGTVLLSALVSVSGYAWVLMRATESAAMKEIQCESCTF